MADEDEWNAPDDKRVLLTFRVMPTSLAWFDALATEYQLGRSQVIRAAMLVAKQHPQKMAQMLAAMKEMNDA